ncbi:hypothetical protein [Catenuloplanes japonicus]|uniref:hypothetical protein n=1 Tax=Catenuloplanes japonicus TaxID=33876 RepID=UPI00068B5F10|nr:hypothetical protein [Catenuloplanes japonicus]
MTVYQLAVPREPVPDPSGTPGPADGFDWSRIRPDPAGVPRPDLFYTLINAGYWLGIAAILAGGTGAVIAMALGEVLGARTPHNGGRWQLFKISGLMVLAGSGVTILSALYRL